MTPTGGIWENKQVDVEVSGQVSQSHGSLDQQSAEWRLLIGRVGCTVNYALNCVHVVM